MSYYYNEGHLNMTAGFYFLNVLRTRPFRSTYNLRDEENLTL